MASDKTLHVFQKVRDFNSGRSLNTQQTFQLSDEVSDKELLKWIFEKIAICIEHEVRESFHFCGESIFNTHRNDPPLS